MAVDPSSARPYWGNGHYYAFTAETASWGDGVNRSQVVLNQLNSTGYLATITSAGENDFITNRSYRGGRIPNNGFLAGSDSTGEGSWIWRMGPETSQGLSYSNWNRGEPNNSKNQDYMQIYTSGYWDDVDGDNVGGYVTEWGSSGPQFTVSLTSPIVNAYEGVSNASITVHLDHAVYGDYTNLSTGNALIDIPLSLGGSAIYGTDYTISVSGGASSYDSTNRILYLLGSSGSSVQDITLSILPVNNSSWRAPRDVTISLGSDGSENIYSLSGSSSQRFWIFDDEPSLSLGQGLAQTIFSSFNGNTSSALPSTANHKSTVLFDANGINENDASYSSYGLYDYFGVRWEGYIRIPETGSYQFYTQSDDGIKLTLRTSNATGSQLDSISNWTIHAPTTNSTKAISLNKGDVVWLQLDYFEYGGGATTTLEWSRPNGSARELVPASALFLSESAARGRNLQEPLSGEATATAFTLFANQSTAAALNVGLGFSTSSGNTTVNSGNAQRRTSANSVVGDDYALYSDSGANQLLASSLTWQPSGSSGSSGLSRDITAKVFSDIYAEANENVQLTLQAGTGYGLTSASSQTITLIDQPLTLALEGVQNPTEGDLGWVTVRSYRGGSLTANPFTGGLPIRYAITGGSASRGSDYLAPQATLSTASSSFKAEDIVLLPANATETRLYISALADAIREGNETISVQLQPNTESDSSGFSYQRYLVDANRASATLSLIDSSAWAAGVAITPADRTGSATIRASLNSSGQQQASIDVHLLSQPQADVTVRLSSTSGSLSSSQLTFTAANWSQPQRVNLSNLSGTTVSSVSASTSSNDSFYASSAGLSASQRIVPANWSSELALTLWEGGSLQSPLPLVSLTPVDGAEGDNSGFGFDIHLDAPRIESPLEVFYSLSPGSGFQLSGSGTDGQAAPERTYEPLLLPAGGTAHVNLGSPTTVASNGAFSAEAWVRPDAISNNPAVLEFADGAGVNEILLGFSGNTLQPFLRVYDGGKKKLGELTAAAGDALSLGAWSHLAYSIDAARNASLYVNGRLVASGVLSQAPLSRVRSSNWVGKSAAASDTNNGYLHGAVRNARVWNRARTAPEIQASMLASAASGGSLIGAWSFNNAVASPTANAAGGPDAKLKQEARFESTATYGAIVPVGASSAEVRLTPVDDSSAEGRESLGLTVVASGQYSLPSGGLSTTAHLDDNDTAALIFSLLSANGAWVEASSDAVVSEGDAANGRRTSLGLSLASRPSADVTVSLDTASFNSRELLVSGPGAPPTLTFTPDNWSVPQALELQGVDDSSDDNDSSQLVSFRISSADAAYAALVPSFTITTVDNDDTSADPDLATGGSGSGPIASLGAPSVATLSEGSTATSTFTVTLSAPATADTLVFVDLDRSFSSGLDDDVILKPAKGSSNLSGLTRLQAKAGTSETASVDSDGINETGASFNAAGLSGSFNATWSGWVRIDTTGWYSFRTAVQGGVRLTLDGQLLIDKWFDQANTWSTGSLFFEAGSFLPITLDYLASTSQEPKIALRWTRPSSNGTAAVEEVLPASQLQRVDSLHLLIPTGASSAALSLQVVDDQVAEGEPGGSPSEQLVLNLLDSRAVELEVRAQTSGASGTQLSLVMGRSDQESLALAAGTVLSLGADSSDSSAAIARFTLSQAVTVHRDRTATVAGQLTNAATGAAFSSSVVGLVGSVSPSPYQVLDPGVSVLATSNWQPDTAGASSGAGSVSLALEPTNRASVSLASGTVIHYSGGDGGSSPLLDLTLLAPLTLQAPSGNASHGPAVSVRVQAVNTSGGATAPAISGLSSEVAIASLARLGLNDNDTPGVRISSDAAGTMPVDPSAVINLSEQGQPLERWLRLTSQPTESVTVYLETSDSSEALLLGGSSGSPQSRLALTFTPETWATPQSVRLQPQDDRLVDGSVRLTVRGRTASNDPFYAIRDTGSSLSVSVADNDKAGVSVGLEQSSISRGGNGFLTFALTAQPSADVTVTLTPGDQQFTINDRSVGRPDTLLFTAADWAVPRRVELRAVDDTTVEDITHSQLTISTSSADAQFAGLAVAPVAIDIVDNDLPTASLEVVSDSTEEAAPGRFRIRLSTAAPASVGADGVLVGYQVSAVQLDPALLASPSSYPSGTGSLPRIAQTPALTGQLRIAPGSTSSDGFVVPIDDFYADTVDKQITVALAAGSGYKINSGAAANSATITILNNDVAGLAIITSGDRALASEGSSGGQFQVVLLSQPASTVTVTLKEAGNPTASTSSRQLGSSSQPFQQTLTFTPSNWFTPQVATFTALDDNRIAGPGQGSSFEAEDASRPNTGLHTAQIAYSFSSSDAAYNSASHSGDSKHFTNTVQTVDVMDRPLPSSTATSVNSSLTSLQEGIESLSLPMVGSLDGKVGSGFRRFLTNLVNSISAAGTPSPRRLQQLIADGIGIAQDHVELAMRGSNVAVAFTFSDEESLFSVPLAADLGLPALGFSSDGSLDAGYGYDARVTLVFTPKGDISLDTHPDQTYVHANYTTSLSDDFRFTGGLGFLQLEAVNQPSVNETIIAAAGDGVTTGLNVDFNLDLSGGAGGDGQLTLAELTSASTNFEDLFQYSFTGDAALSLGVTTSIGGSAAIPSFKFDLATLLPLFDYSNQAESETEEAATSIYFDNIRLDLGSYVTGMLTPVVDGIDSILNPLYPIVDALYADTQIFSTIGLEGSFDQNDDGVVSAIDLAQWFADFYAKTDPTKGKKLQATVDATVEFLDVVKGVMDLVRELEAMAEEGSFYVDFGSYELPAFQAGSNAEDDGTDQVAVEDPSHPGAPPPDLATDTASQADEGGKDASGKGNSSFRKVMDQLDELGFTIPLIDDPTNAIQLLLGQDVDLFTWRMPSMGMQSEIEKSFHIYPGIDGIIEGGFGVDATIGFGFDTYGLNEWRAGGFKPAESWKVFDGFYVADRDSEDVDIPEFSLNASMGAGLGLSAVVVRADITGGLEAGASFDLLDEGEIAGTDDGRIRGGEISSRIANPLDLFELVGDLSAYLQAKVKVGIDMGFFSIWDTVWQEKLATIPIFEFGVGGSYGSGTASNGYLENATVFWDANGNGTIDSIEPWTTTGEDANFHLAVDHRSFDHNRNGVIDADEGRFVVFGGTDTSTGLPLQIPLLAPFGKMVTPLTTLHALGLELGYDAEALNAWMQKAFGLGSFDPLTFDPVLTLQGQTSPVPDGTDAQRAVLGHTKVHLAFDLLLTTLQQLAPEALPNDTSQELALLKLFTRALLEQDPTTSINDALAAAAGEAAISWSEAPEQNGDAGLAAIADEVGRHGGRVISAIGRQLDDRAASLRGAEGPTFLAGFNALKTEAFQRLRSGTSELSRELHQFDTPAALAAEVNSRLAALRNEEPLPPSQPLLAVSGTAADLPEGNSGSTLFRFEVRRSGDSSGVSSVDWAVTGSGPAPADAADFTAGALPSGSVRFEAGETRRTLVVELAGDTAVEANEGFLLSLGQASGAELEAGFSTALGRIGNDDRPSGSPGGNTGGGSGGGSTGDGGDRGPGSRRAGAGVDELIGTADRDTFVFPEIESASEPGTLRYDSIVGYQPHDRLSVPSGRPQLMGGGNGRRLSQIDGVADALTTKAIRSALGRQFNGREIAALRVRGLQGTLLAMNAGGRGFDRDDMLVFLPDYRLSSDTPVQLA